MNRPWGADLPLDDVTAQCPARSTRVCAIAVVRGPGLVGGQVE